MRSWLICIVLISMLVVSQEVASETKFLKFPDPCQQPNPPLGCSIGNAVPANPYRRGCSKITRCRGG
ncbi:protein RALF-like 10 [Cucurbita pepo subsp. pepo]|uniref:protein RALF-like 10 n=1 Tax=Cucurbita pepo subsp. pepo TaxID=3664 RepID=UPI000C9D732A|nr:protein RALF-like 10 [Cucurbita pepo subsp. pepo]